MGIITMKPETHFMLLYQGHGLVDNISEVLFVAYRKVRHSFRIARWCLREAAVVVVPPM